MANFLDDIGEWVGSQQIINDDGTPTVEFVTFLWELVNKTNEQQVKQFSGNPNSNVIGLLGQLCYDTSAATAPIVYVKTTDGGNTGWVAI